MRIGTFRLAIFSVLSDELQTYYNLQFAMQGTLISYWENVSFVRAQKMPSLNVFRDPPGHCAGFVNEWNRCFHGGFQEKFKIGVFHNISSY